LEKPKIEKEFTRRRKGAKDAEEEFKGGKKRFTRRSQRTRRKKKSKDSHAEIAEGAENLE
jgi:hypothetical protein